MVDLVIAWEWPLPWLPSPQRPKSPFSVDLQGFQRSSNAGQVHMHTAGCRVLRGTTLKGKHTPENTISCCSAAGSHSTCWLCGTPILTLPGLRLSTWPQRHTAGVPIRSRGSQVRDLGNLCHLSMAHLPHLFTWDTTDFMEWSVLQDWMSSPLEGSRSPGWLQDADSLISLLGGTSAPVPVLPFPADLSRSIQKAPRGPLRLPAHSLSQPSQPALAVLSSETPQPPSTLLLALRKRSGALTLHPQMLQLHGLPSQPQAKGPASSSSRNLESLDSFYKRYSSLQCIWKTEAIKMTKNRDR